MAKQTTGPAGEGYTRYFYEGSRVVLEADADGAITAHNTYSINLASRTAGEEAYYYFYNAHGDVVGLSGAGGGEVVRYRYDAFGTPVSVEGDADNSITYAGYQYDAESGLYYLNARYYDSMTARFLTEDTYGGRAGDPLSLHRYTYCANNPLRYTDPSGHFFGALLRFVGGAVIGGVIEYVSQKFIEKREKVDWKAVAYEALVGGASAVFGGAGKQVAEGIGNAVGGVAKKVAKAAATEAFWGGVEDVGKQVFVDGKTPGEFDYGELFDTMATAGVGGVFGAAVDFYADYRKHARLKKVPVPVEVERVHYECVYHVPDCPNHVSNIRVVTKDTKWEMQEVWEYGGTDRSFADYLGDHYSGRDFVTISASKTSKEEMYENIFSGTKIYKRPPNKLEEIVYRKRSLNNRQQNILSQLQKSGDSVIVRKKDFSLTDLSAVTAYTHNEFAVFTNGGRRMIIRGDSMKVPVGPSIAKEFSAKGWRWSAHSHPGISDVILEESVQDRIILREFMNQEFSTTVNSLGKYNTFRK